MAALSADESHEFAWAALEDAGDVVVAEQPPVAVYTNPKGAVVVRQRGDDRDDDDAWIWFAPEHAPAVAAAIMAAAGLDATDIADLAPEPAQDASKPTASTAAERQRRYRQRKKKEPALFDGDDRNVTECETVTPRNGLKT